MLEVQLGKLGILPPEGSFWPALKSAFNIMWANNGDIISRQYAGTNALKVHSFLDKSFKKMILILYFGYREISLELEKGGSPA